MAGGDAVHPGDHIGQIGEGIGGGGVLISQCRVARLAWSRLWSRREGIERLRPGHRGVELAGARHFGDGGLPIRAGDGGLRIAILLAIVIGVRHRLHPAKTIVGDAINDD